MSEKFAANGESLLLDPSLSLLAANDIPFSGNTRMPDGVSKIPRTWGHFFAIGVDKRDLVECVRRAAALGFWGKLRPTPHRL